MLLLLAIPALFVGNQACAGCHADITAAYAATPMAQSSGRVTSVPKGTFRHEPSGVQYEIDSAGAVRFSKGSATGGARLEFYIGSNAAGRSFLFQRDSFLFEAPVTWYTRKAAWDVSPGYEHDRFSRWNRAIEPSCLFCHASQTQPLSHTQNGFRSPPFDHDGISCERCHGPGSQHIAGKGAMVNPAKLDPERRDSVCAQCHLSGEAGVVRAGREMTAYRPGDRLSDFAAYFVADQRAPLHVNSHVEKLAQSRCKQSAGDRMWCGSCHDPHRVPAPAERAAFFRERCLGCHEVAACKRGSDCANCHMPKSAASDANHGVFTDHSIPRVPSKPAPSPAWRLRGFSAADTGDRELGLAYAEVAARTGDPRHKAEAMRLLSAAPKDAEVRTRLAFLLEGNGSLEPAAEHYEAALRENPDQVVAMVNLGRLLGMQGLLDRAILLWRQALAHNPCLEDAGINLQIALRAANQPAAAEAVRRSQAWCVFPNR